MYFFSFTHGGELASISAAQATIDVMEDERVIDHMWKMGANLREQTNRLIDQYELGEHVEMVGLDPWPILQFNSGDDKPEDYDLALKSLFQREVVMDGILFNGNHFFCNHHDAADIATTVDVYDSALEFVSTAVESGDVYDLLQGDMIQPIFRRDISTIEES